MYIVSVNARTRTANTSDDFNLDCISSPIIIKSSSQTVRTDDNSAPNIYLTFSGNFSQHKNNLTDYESMIYNCLLVKHGLVLERSISLYEGSIKAVLGTSGSTQSFNSLIASLNDSFALSSEVVLRSASILDNSFVFSVDPATSETSSSTGTIATSGSTGEVTTSASIGATTTSATTGGITTSGTTGEVTSSASTGGITAIASTGAVSSSATTTGTTGTKGTSVSVSSVTTSISVSTGLPTITSSKSNSTTRLLTKENANTTPSASTNSVSCVKVVFWSSLLSLILNLIKKG